jgi:DNA-binding LytR/AlgR family response regulator
MEYHGFKSGANVLRYLEKKPLDILFLDIDLGEESGIQIAAQLALKYPKLIVIFVTGHREFAGDAFEVEAMGYLVKPYDIKKMESILKKALLQVTALNHFDEPREIVITDENLKKKVNLADIIYIERQAARSVIFTKDKVYNVYETLTSLLERLGEGFLRVNQGEVVAAREIAEIKGNDVYLKNGKLFSIGRTYRKELLDTYFGRKTNKA